jgi:hypothetical protein
LCDLCWPLCRCCARGGEEEHLVAVQVRRQRCTAVQVVGHHTQPILALDLIAEVADDIAVRAEVFDITSLAHIVAREEVGKRVATAGARGHFHPGCVHVCVCVCVCECVRTCASVCVCVSMS